MRCYMLSLVWCDCAPSSKLAWSHYRVSSKRSEVWTWSQIWSFIDMYTIVTVIWKDLTVREGRCCTSGGNGDIDRDLKCGENVSKWNCGCRLEAWWSWRSVKCWWLKARRFQVRESKLLLFQWWELSRTKAERNDTQSYIELLLCLRMS